MCCAVVEGGVVVVVVVVKVTVNPLYCLYLGWRRSSQVGPFWGWGLGGGGGWKDWQYVLQNAHD